MVQRTPGVCLHSPFHRCACATTDAYLTVGVEILGGVAFLLGAFIAIVSIPSILMLVVAIFSVHLTYGFSSIKLMSFSNGRAQFRPPGYECDLLYIAAIVALAIAGPGPWSLDGYRAKAVRV